MTGTLLMGEGTNLQVVLFSQIKVGEKFKVAPKATIWETRVKGTQPKWIEEYGPCPTCGEFDEWRNHEDEHGRGGHRCPNRAVYIELPAEPPETAELYDY